MCGIFGCASTNQAVAPLIHSSLKRLEYRGYDSVGEATIKDGRILVIKDKGKIDAVHKKYNLDSLMGNIGIGQTRWATHGIPAKSNAHPHLDCTGTVAVVHNGIIENFNRLRETLSSHGHKLQSNTDTETIPHLIEDGLAKGASLLEAVQKAVLQLEGSYALAILSSREPNKIVCARKESPLVLGIGSGEMYCASDVSAFLPLTRKALILDEDEIVTLTANEIMIFSSKDLHAIGRDSFEITWTQEMAEKGGLPHFMLKEIYEQPEAIKRASMIPQDEIDQMATEINKAGAIFLVACGTSYYACLASSYIFSKIANVHVLPVIASEFPEQYSDALNAGAAVIAVSQSGETTDTLNAIRCAKRKGSSTFAVTNVVGSTLTRMTDMYISQLSGPEIGVAATKTFTGQLSVLARLAAALATIRRENGQDISEIQKSIQRLPQLLNLVIRNSEPRIKMLAERFKDHQSFCFLGRGVNASTALEGRLKLLELAYTYSLAFPAGESKHGLIAVVGQGYPVIFIAPNDGTRSKIVGNIMEMKARGGKIISIHAEGDDEVAKLSDEHIPIPHGVHELLSPIPYVIPLQLFAYYLSLLRGHNPDMPRNLAKSVTVQ